VYGRRPVRLGECLAASRGAEQHGLGGASRLRLLCSFIEVGGEQAQGFAGRGMSDSGFFLILLV